MDNVIIEPITVDNNKLYCGPTSDVRFRGKCQIAQMNPRIMLEVKAEWRD